MLIILQLILVNFNPELILTGWHSWFYSGQNLELEWAQNFVNFSYSFACIQSNKSIVDNHNTGMGIELAYAICGFVVSKYVL